MHFILTLKNSILVDKMDLDQDGKVTEDELRSWIKHTSKRYLIEDRDRSWKDLSLNEDDKLTWDTYYKSVISNPDDEGTLFYLVFYLCLFYVPLVFPNPSAYFLCDIVYLPYLTFIQPSKLVCKLFIFSSLHFFIPFIFLILDDEESLIEIIEKDRNRWKEADLNGDGLLDKDEYLDFLHPEDSHRMRHVVIDETMADLDTNKDGFIDLDEYIRECLVNFIRLIHFIILMSPTRLGTPVFAFLSTASHYEFDSFIRYVEMLGFEESLSRLMFEYLLFR
ncbi:unnamed protein product [Protopolystoma xenopodis]|uniref:EF-hand domain-containing protein n=1 Tax=Protopolystoma xenopodis TaxID=117903 RepID=A0A448WW96_9PLAT|nr:unnamed protein product [Protopolystoma xenopodis]